jgi:excinuclease ABC subunit A
MIDRVLELPEGTRIQLLSPVVRGRKGEYHKLLDDVRKGGYVRVRIDGNIYDINEDITLDKNKKHNIEIVVDRLVIKEGINKRLTDSMETVMHLSGGIVIIDIVDDEEIHFSQNFACNDCGISIDELAPRMFSFNNPFGACPKCSGLGTLMEIDPDMIIPDKTLTLNEGAIKVGGWNTGADNSWAKMFMIALSKKYDFSLDIPVNKLQAV